LFEGWKLDAGSWSLDERTMEKKDRACVFDQNFRLSDFRLLYFQTN